MFRKDIVLVLFLGYIVVSVLFIVIGDFSVTNFKSSLESKEKYNYYEQFTGAKTIYNSSSLSINASYCVLRIRILADAFSGDVFLKLESLVWIKVSGESFYDKIVSIVLKKASELIVVINMTVRASSSGFIEIKIFEMTNVAEIKDYLFYEFCMSFSKELAFFIVLAMILLIPASTYLYVKERKYFSKTRPKDLEYVGKIIRREIFAFGSIGIIVLLSSFFGVYGVYMSVLSADFPNILKISLSDAAVLWFSNPYIWAMLLISVIGLFICYTDLLISFDADNIYIIVGRQVYFGVITNTFCDVDPVDCKIKIVLGNLEFFARNDCEKLFIVCDKLRKIKSNLLDENTK